MIRCPYFALFNKDKTIDSPFLVFTIIVFVTVYILLVSKSLHLLYCVLCSSSNLSNSAIVISLISFAILIFSFILNVFSFLQYK